jgi:signal transduction histidine kinase
LPGPASPLYEKNEKMKKKIFAVWVCLALVFFTVVYLFTYQEELRVNLDRFAHSQLVLSMIYDLENNLADAEAATRGFVLTGEEQQLEPYRQDIKEADRIFGELTRMTAAEPAQQRLLKTLQPLINQRKDLLEQSIELRRQQGLQDAEHVALAQRASKIQNRIRTLLDRLEDSEKKLLLPGYAQRQRNIRSWILGLALGTVGSFVILIGVMVMLNREITQRKKAENQLAGYQDNLRYLASQLSLAEEQERRRIAVYLHDRIGHSLALANIKLGELDKSVQGANSESLKAGLGQIGKLMEQAIRDAHTLTFEISPPILYELGLEAAVEWLTEKVQQEHGIAASFESDHQPLPLAEDVRVLVFQALSEVLVNAVKHARARNLAVSLQREGGYLCARVQDDGVGFQIAETGSHPKMDGGFGLFSIRERLKPFGGVVEVESEPGAGTRVTLRVPLQDRPPEEAS